MTPLSWIRPLLGACAWCALVHAAAATGLTPELQHVIRASTFEVVMKKPDKDPVSYEKPLPLELLPYIERTDAYRAVGTAFALGHNTYVTAAHVLLAGINSQFGAPALRNAEGTILTIDKIVKFSAYQDFVVFSLQKDPAPAGFAINQDPKLDDAVLAVGNALGEGIVIRDGLYTSSTAEEQDNRWKWIRFSAAASPGNSGGPLLDVDGQVIGIVIGKSPNENLNYSLPIAQVLSAPEQRARFDQRALISLPFLHGTQTYAYQDGFDLPLSWSDFAHAYQAIVLHHDELARAALLKRYADTLFPRGSGTEAVLYAPHANDYRPRLIAQQEDGRWSAIDPEYSVAELPGDGSISTAGVAGAMLLSLVRPDHATDDAFYADSKVFMDLALNGINLRRTVGPDQVRVTSLGPALSDERYVDHYGRRWQQRVWAVPYLDVYLVCLMLPTPNGYAAIAYHTPSATEPQATERVRLLADQFDVSFSGTLAQWRSYLARRTLLPDAFSGVKLEDKPQWALRTPRFVSSVPGNLISLDEKSLLNVTLGFFPDLGRVVWDIEDVWWNHDQQQRSGLGIWRRLRPPSTARLELRTDFDDMRARNSPYDEQYSRESASTYVVSTIKNVAGAHGGTVSDGVLYGLTLRGDATKLHSGAGAQLMPTLQVLEAGQGAEISAGGGEVVQVRTGLDAQIQSFQKMAETSDSSFGRDGRNRQLSDDVRELIASAHTRLQEPGANEQEIAADFAQRAVELTGYWQQIAKIHQQEELWRSFLTMNGRPAETAHSELVKTDQQALTLITQDGLPTTEWTARASHLRTDLEQERLDSRAQKLLTAADYHARTTECPAPATAPVLATNQEVKMLPPNHSPDEFYPAQSRRVGEQGRIILSVNVSARGCGTEVAIAMSSGSQALDDAALRFFESLEFVPAQVQGQPAGARKVFTVLFKLKPDDPAALPGLSQDAH